VLERAFALGLIAHEGTGWGKTGSVRLASSSLDPPSPPTVAASTEYPLPGLARASGAKPVTPSTIEPPPQAYVVSTQRNARGVTDADDDSADEAELVMPGAPNAPPDEGDIKDVLALLRQHAAAGCHYLGATYAVAELVPSDGRRTRSVKQERMKIAIAHAETLGRIGVRRTELGAWLHLLDAPPPGRPGSAAQMQAGMCDHLSTPTRALMLRPSDDLRPLVEFVRAGTDAHPRKMRDARTHFMKKTPSAPFGTVLTQFRHVVERAEELGLLVRSGTGYSKKAWLRPA
jgi:hypothetical protein